jgi:hypothetical protein
MAKVKYNGTLKKKITWNSMGKGYAYNVRPGQIIQVPEDQITNVCGCGSFIVISSASKLREQGPKIVKKTVQKQVEPTPVKVVKPLPVLMVDEPVEVEEVVVNEPVEVTEVTVDEPVEEREDEDEECEKTIDYTSIRKADLKDMCKKNGLKVSGNRDDLIARLVAFDKGIILDG